MAARSSTVRGKRQRRECSGMADGKQGFKTQKREQTREMIVEAYLELLEEKDFDAVTVSALCRAAGIVRSTFYTYFSDIYAVAQFIEDRLIAKLNWVDEQARGAEALNRKRAKTAWGFPIAPPYGFDLWFDVYEMQKPALKAMLGPHGDPYFEQKLRAHLVSHVRLLMDEDGMPDDELRVGFSESTVELHFILIRNWMLHENTTLTKERIKTIINTVRIGGSVEGLYLDELLDHAALIDGISPIGEIEGA